MLLFPTLLHVHLGVHGRKVALALGALDNVHRLITRYRWTFLCMPPLEGTGKCNHFFFLSAVRYPNEKRDMASIW